MKNLAPAAESRQELNLDRQKSQFSYKPHKPQGINRIRILNEIAEQWVDKGCYESKGRALLALVGGDL